MNSGGMLLAWARVLEACGDHPHRRQREDHCAEDQYEVQRRSPDCLPDSCSAPLAGESLGGDTYHVFVRDFGAHGNRQSSINNGYAGEVARL